MFSSKEKIASHFKTYTPGYVLQTRDIFSKKYYVRETNLITLVVYKDDLYDIQIQIYVY